MPIPSFDVVRNILPPHRGDPRSPVDLSPYSCTIAELCARFATTVKRKQILEGFLNLRAELFSLGIRGFQWLDGSFVEDIETQEGRDPQDMDVVTFADTPADPASLTAAFVTKPEVWDPIQSKSVYFVDHYFVSLGSDSVRVVKQTQYWYGLFSHRRDGLWKGMLAVDLRVKADDDAARIYLGSKP